MSMLLKLAAVVHMVDALIPFTKYIMEEFKRDINLWLTASTKGLVGEQPDPAEVETILMTELMETIKKPYMDGSLFHLHMLTNLLQRPIQQHCIKKNFDSYRQMLFPPLGNIRNPSPIHLVWVPAKPRNSYATINHVVPAVCDLGVYGTHKEECAFLGLGVCAFTEGFNEEHSPGWVECTLCGQWVHDVCMDVSAKDFSQRDDFPCGCDILSNGVVQLKSASYYLSLKLNDIDLDFKEIVKKIDEKMSYRKDLFSREGNRIMKYSMRWGRFGPFTSDFIDDVNSHLIPFVQACSRHLVPDVYMPEVLLQIITRREGINRLQAEMVLIQYSTTSHS